MGNIKTFSIFGYQVVAPGIIGTGHDIDNANQPFILRRILWDFQVTDMFDAPIPDIINNILTCRMRIIRAIGETQLNYAPGPIPAPWVNTMIGNGIEVFRPVDLQLNIPIQNSVHIGYEFGNHDAANSYKFNMATLIEIEI